MTQLVEILVQSPAGRLFLANLHHALTQKPAHIDLANFRRFWLQARGLLTSGATPPRAREAIFELFFAKENLSLRFQRPAAAKRPDDYLVHTAITPFDLVHNKAKAVVDFKRMTATLPRDGRPVREWTPDECERLAGLLTDPAFWARKTFAHRYGIFWATPALEYSTVDATCLRDAQGLVHIEKGEPLIQLSFACTAKVPVDCASPTVIEANYHRRFKARPVLDPHHATAANLEPLRLNRTLADGAPELVLSPMPMSTLRRARYAGHVATFADLNDADTVAPATQEANDEIFSDILIEGRLDPIKIELIQWLEATA